MEEASNQVAQEQLEAPAVYECSDDDFAPAVRKQVKVGVWYPAEGYSVKRGVVPTSKNLSMQISFAPLDAEGKPIKKAIVRLDVYPNLKNKQFPTHERPDTFFSCYCLCRSLVDGFPQLPHKAGNTGMYETSTGAIVSSKESYRMRDEIEVAVQRQMAEFYNHEELIVGKRCYIFVELRKNQNSGKEFIAVTKTRSERPTDEPVIEDGNVFAGEAA